MDPLCYATSCSRRRGGCVYGLDRHCCVGDLDLDRPGLLRDGDGDREHAVFVRGGDVLTIQTLPEEELADELALRPLGDLDLVASGRGPSPRRPHGEDVLFDRQLDRARICTGQVEMNLELVAPTVGVYREKLGTTSVAQLLGGLVEHLEWFESHQHGWILSLTLEQLGRRRRSGLDVWEPTYSRNIELATLF